MHPQEQVIKTIKEPLQR